MKKQPHIAIVGAGLIGSYLACLLAKKGGCRISVYERRQDPSLAKHSSGRSINLAISERGWTALKKLDIDTAIKPMSIPMYGRKIHHAQGHISFQPYDKKKRAIYSISREMLNQYLIKKVQNQPHTDLFFNQKLLDIHFETHTLTYQNTKTKTVNNQSFDLIIGADGAFSATRGAMQKTMGFNYLQQYLSHGYKELHIPAKKNGTFPLDKHALHIWPRKHFMLIALPNTDGSFTATFFAPIKGANSFDTLKNRGKIQSFFNTHFADVLPFIPHIAEQFYEHKTAHLLTIKCHPWVHHQTVLVGDAAHAIVPFYGQGMNAGLESASILAELIDTPQIEWSQALDTYNRTRHIDTDTIADLAISNFEEMCAKVDDDTFLLRKKLEQQLAKTYPDIFLPVYSLISFSNMPYAQAKQIGIAQKEVLDQLMSIKDIAQKWNHSSVMAKAKAMLMEKM